VVSHQPGGIRDLYDHRRDCSLLAAPRRQRILTARSSTVTASLRCALFVIEKRRIASGVYGQRPGRRLVQPLFFLVFLLRRELLLVLFLVFLPAPVSHAVPLVREARLHALRVSSNIRVLEARPN